MIPAPSLPTKAPDIMKEKKADLVMLCLSPHAMGSVNTIETSHHQARDVCYAAMVTDVHFTSKQTIQIVQKKFSREPSSRVLEEHFVETDEKALFAG